MRLFHIQYGTIGKKSSAHFFFFLCFKKGCLLFDTFSLWLRCPPWLRDKDLEIFGHSSWHDPLFLWTFHDVQHHSLFLQTRRYHCCVSVHSFFKAVFFLSEHWVDELVVTSTDTNTLLGLSNAHRDLAVQDMCSLLLSTVPCECCYHRHWCHRSKQWFVSWDETEHCSVMERFVRYQGDVTSKRPWITYRLLKVREIRVVQLKMTGWS